MNSSLLTSFGKMFPDFSLPALANHATDAVQIAEKPQVPTTRVVGFAAATDFADEFYQSIAGQTSSRLFPRLGSSGWMEHGHFSTLSGLVSHSADDACSVSSLSDILEPSVAQRYFLSPRACQGILRRAEKRGRELPPALQRALQQVAESISPDEDKKTI